MPVLIFYDHRGNQGNPKTKGVWELTQKAARKAWCFSGEIGLNRGSIIHMLHSPVPGCKMCVPEAAERGDCLVVGLHKVTLFQMARTGTNPVVFLNGLHRKVQVSSDMIKLKTRRDWDHCKMLTHEIRSRIHQFRVLAVGCVGLMVVSKKLNWGLPNRRCLFDARIHSIRYSTPWSERISRKPGEPLGRHRDCITTRG